MASSTRVELGFQGGKMLMSLIESIGVFMHSAFILTLFSGMKLSQHNIGLVGISSFAALGRLILSAGYILNLVLTGISLTSAESIWFFSLVGVEAACCASVLIAAVSWTPLLGELSKKHKSQAETSNISLAEYKAAFTQTLFSIAFPSKRENRSPSIWTKALYVSSLSALVLYTIQGLLLLDYHVSLYNNHFIVAVVQEGMMLCFIYAFINYVSVSRNGEFYSASRPVIMTVALGGAALSIWQILSLVIGCAYQGMTSMDAFVMGLLGTAICANALMLISAWLLRDIHNEQQEQRPSRRSSDLSNISATAMSSSEGVTRPLPQKSAEDKLRKRALIALCLYIPNVLGYAFILAIFDGHDDISANSLPLSTTDVSGNVQVGATGTTLPSSTSTSTSNIDDFVFVMNLPGLQVLFHFGLVFIVLCFDAIRKKSSMTVSLSTASLISSHAFVVLAASLALILSNGQPQTLLSQPNMGEIGELIGLLGWFVHLIPLSISLHVLGRFRRRHNSHRRESLQQFINPKRPFHEVAIRPPGGHLDGMDIL